jgi:tetratricopeptide (TPR) repeat protein
VITLNLGGAYAYDGRLDEAIAILDKLIENEPTFASSCLYRSYCFMLKGMKERAYADLEVFHKLARDEDRYKWALAILYGWSGEGEKALPLIEELIRKVGKSSILEADIAGCYAILGDRDEFFNWIDRAISAKMITVVELRSSPLYDKVREDPRFPEIFKRLGLPY